MNATGRSLTEHRPPSRIRRSLIPVASSAAVIAAAALVGGQAPVVASAASRSVGGAVAPMAVPQGRTNVTTDAAAVPAPGCPGPTYPPGNLYQFTFTGTLTGSLTVSQTPAGPITLPPITGSFCGLLQLPSETAIVLPQNLTINPIHATIARATVPVTVVATGTSTGIVDPVRASDGGLNLVLNAPIAAQTGLFGIQCALPVDLALSTQGPSGVPLQGPLQAATATLSQAGFVLQPAVSTGASGTCPAYLATEVDSLLGLPNNHTFTTVTVSISVSLQQ